MHKVMGKGRYLKTVLLTTKILIGNQPLANPMLVHVVAGNRSHGLGSGGPNYMRVSNVHGDKIKERLAKFLHELRKPPVTLGVFHVSVSI
jgi:hypothetical protein